MCQQSVVIELGGKLSCIYQVKLHNNSELIGGGEHISISATILRHHYSIEGENEIAKYSQIFFNSLRVVRLVCCVCVHFTSRASISRYYFLHYHLSGGIEQTRSLDKQRS